MSADLPKISSAGSINEKFLEQKIEGSRKTSNYVIGSMVVIGGVGFLLASLSSYQGKDFLPIGHPATLIFVPQGLLMGIYGVAAILLAIYLWTLIAVNFGAGINLFNKEKGTLTVSRRGLFKKIELEIPLKEVKAVKLEVRDGINPLRRITLRIKGRRDIPLSGVSQPKPLVQLEQEGAQLARFLDVNLEGL